MVNPVYFHIELSTLHSHSSFSADDEGEETDGARGDGLARSKTRNIPLKHQPRVYDDTSEELPQHYMMRLQSMQSMEITSPVTSPTTAQAAVTTASTPQDKSADTHKQVLFICYLMSCCQYCPVKFSEHMLLVIYVHV